MVRSVEDEPYIELERWHFARQGDEYRLVGVPAGSHKGRITSAIAAYDADERRAVTASGRVYRLVGEPDPDIGCGALVAYVLAWGVAALPIALADESDVVDSFAPKSGMGFN